MDATYPSIHTPFNVNNVDCTVAANALAGMTQTILSARKEEQVTWFDDDIKVTPPVKYPSNTYDFQKLYTSTADFLAWAVETKSVYTRPDIGLVYYPSVYMLTWFLSRTLFTLESNKPLPFKELENARLLFDALKC